MLLEKNTQVQWGHALEGLQETEEGVECDMVATRTQEHFTVKARVLVAADGFNSQVRQICSAKVRGNSSIA